MTEDRVIWRRDLRAALGISDETLRRMMKTGRLPKPDVEISQRTRGWRLSTLRANGFNIVTSEEATSTPPAKMPVEAPDHLRSVPDSPSPPRHIQRDLRRPMTGLRTRPGILTDDQVAALLDCEVSVVQSMARTAELPGLKIGRPWLFPREALMARLNEMALKGGRINPTPRKFMPLTAKRIRELWRDANASTAEVAVTFARLLEKEHGINI